MNQLESNLAPEPDLAESLLNLAQWLDSQDSEYRVYEAHKQGIPLKTMLANDPIFNYYLSYPANAYYSTVFTNNKERVLAVLMLREMILSGDA